MRRLMIAITLALTVLPALSQREARPFQAYIYNKEYKVFLRMDFYDESVNVPGQELYGALPGYLGKENNSFCWVITSAKVKGKSARIALINDYGSEDLTATLRVVNDSTYELQQEEGSPLKVPKDGKWQKLPKTLEFKRR